MSVALDRLRGGRRGKARGQNGLALSPVSSTQSRGIPPLGLCCSLLPIQERTNLASTSVPIGGGACFVLLRWVHSSAGIFLACSCGFLDLGWWMVVLSVLDFLQLRLEGWSGWVEYSNLGCWFFGGTVWGRSVLVGFAANAMREYGRWTRSVRRNYWPELSEEVESYIRIWCLWIVFASTYLRTAHSEPPVWPEPRAHGLGARLRRALDSSLCGVEQDKMLVLITAPASSEACKKRVYSAVSGRRWLCGYISSIWFDCSHIFKSWVLELFFFPSGLGVWGLQLGNWFLELKLSNANCGFTIFIICVLCACSEI